MNSILTKTAVKNIYDSVENASRRDFYDRAMASLWGDAMEFDGTQKMTQRIREVQPNQTKQPSYAEVQSVLNEMGQIIYFHLSPDKTTESYLFIWDVLSRRARKRGFPCPRVICGDRGRVADLPILSEIVFPNPPTPYDKIEGAMFRSVDDIKRPSYVESKSANTNWDQVVKTAAGYRPSYRIDQPHVGRRITELGSKASILYTTFTKKTTDCFLDYDAVCIPDQPDSRVACIRAPADIKQRLHDLLRWNEHDTQKPKLVADITLRQQIECVFEEVDLGTVGDPVPFAMRRADGSTILWRNTQRLEATHNWANTEFGKSIRGSESADCYLASLIYRRNVKMGIKMKGDRDFGTCALWEIEAINAVGRNLFNTTLIPDLPDFPPTEEKFGSQVDFTHVKSSTAKITQSHVTIALQSATAVTIADAAAPTVLARVRDAMDLVVDPRTLGRNELPAEAHSSSASSVHANNAPSSYSDSETHSSSLSGPATSSSHGVVRATVPAVPVAPSSAATSSIPSAKRRRRPPPLLVADLPESTPVSKLFSTFENSLFLRLLAEAPHVSASVGKPQPNFKHIETQWAELVATQRFPMAPKSATQLQAYLRKLKQSINVKFIAAEMSRRAKRRDAPSPLPSARDICVLCCTEHPGPCTMFDDEHLKPAISRLFAGVQLAADCDLPTAVDILVPPNQPSVASSSSADPLPEADSSPQGGVAPEPTASSSADMPEEHEPSVQNRKRLRAWTQEEDSLLVELTNKHRAANNEIDWALVLSGWREKMEELCAVGTASSLFDRTKEAMKGRIKTRLNSPIDRQSSSGTKRQKLTAAPTQPTSHLSNSVSSASARGHDSSVISSSSSPHLLGPIGGGPAAPLPVYTSNPPVPLSRFPPSSSSSPLPTGTPFPNTDASAVDHLFNVAESARDPHEAEGAMYAAGVLLGKSSAAAEALSPFSATPSILSRPPSTLTHFPIPSSDNFAGKHAPPAPVLDSLFSSSSNPSVPSASTASSSPSASASTFALSSSSASQTFIAHPLAVPGPVPSSHAPNPTAVSKTTKGSKRKISDSKLAKKRDRRSTFKWTKGFENTVQQCYDAVTEDKPPGFFATKFWKGVVDDLERKQTVAPQSFELVEKFRKVANGIKNIAKSVAVTDYHQAAQIVSKKLQEKKDKSPGDQSVWMIPSVAHIETILGGKTRNGK